MSEVIETTEETTEVAVSKFANVAALIVHLEGLGDAAVSAAEIASELVLLTSVPATAGQRRGQLSGLNLEDMTLEQLKREKINAGSVHYKAVKRGAPAETIAKNAARLEAVKARILVLEPAPVAEETAPEGAVAEAEVVEEVAAEI